MKKILFIAALILSASSYSEIKISGGELSGNPIFSKNWTGLDSQDLSGVISFTGGNHLIINLDPGDGIKKGTKFILEPGQSIRIGTIYGARGYEILTVSEKSYYEFTEDIGGGDQYEIILHPTRYEIEEIPRSRVNLDLVRNIKATTFKNLEKSKENSYTIDAEYIGGLGGSYKDKSQKIKYSSTSNGMSLTGTRNFGSITLGATFGYQESEVKYKNLLNNVREDIDTYQLGLSFRHNFTKEIDLTLSMTYGEGKHKFKTADGLGDINGASFKSKIYDFEARLGRKYTFTNAYIKPYLGIGTTKVEEKKIEKLNMDRSKKTEGYAILGTYGALNFGKLDLFGNIEYTQRLEKDSYHAKRHAFNSSYNMNSLNYSRAEYNFSLGARYNITEAFNVSTNYELDNLKNSIIKVGFGLEF